MENQTTWPASWEICMQVRKQQLELDMEQWTGSKLGKEYIKAVFCHLACLTFTQSSDQFSSVAQSCPTLCDPMNRSTPGLPVHHQLPGFTQIHVHRVSDAIQPSHPLSSPYPPAPNPSQDQSLSNYIMQNARLDDAQTGIKIARRIINNLGKMLKGTSSTLGTSCEGFTYWKRLWCWEGLGAGGEGTTEDERAGWHHWLDGHESEWTPGVGDGQGGLVYCDSWGCKESDTTERLNWTELMQMTPHLWQKVKRNWRASWWKWKRRVKKLA